MDEQPKVFTLSDEVKTLIERLDALESDLEVSGENISLDGVDDLVQRIESLESRDPGVRQNQLIEIQSRLTELENRHVDIVSNVPSTVEVDLGPLEERISKIESLKILVCKEFI